MLSGRELVRGLKSSLLMLGTFKRYRIQRLTSTKEEDVSEEEVIAKSGKIPKALFDTFASFQSKKYNSTNCDLGPFPCFQV